MPRLKDVKIYNGMIFRFPLSGRLFRVIIVPKKGSRPETIQVHPLDGQKIGTFEEYSDIIVEFPK